MKSKKIIAMTFLFPTLLFAAGTETWKLSGLTEKNKMQVKRSLEKAHDVGEVDIDMRTGIVKLEPKLGRSIDDKDVQNAISGINGVTIAKQSDGPGSPIQH